MDAIVTYLPALGVIGTGVGVIVKLSSFIARMDTLISALAKRVRKLEKKLQKEIGKK